MQQEHAPLVSIVITSYNYDRFVGAAIQSALAQSYRPLEVIVVDDGSTDASRAGIERFGDRVRAIFQDNAGETEATNAGFAASRGEIVMFLDSDDALRADAAARVVAAFRPGVSKVQFRLATIDVHGQFVGTAFPNYPPCLTPGAIRREALRTGLYPCPPTSGNAYGRDFLRRVMPLPSAAFRLGPDGPLNTVAPLYGDVLTLDEALGCYRVHGRNMWAMHGLQSEKFRDYVLHDCKRGIFLQWHAMLRGEVAAQSPLQRAPLHLQYRLASIRLRPAAHPVRDDSALGLLWLGLRAALAASDAWPARTALALWFALVALAPRPFAAWLVALRFVPSSRPAVVRRWLDRLGVLRAPALSPAPAPTDDAAKPALADLPEHILTAAKAAALPIAAGDGLSQGIPVDAAR